MNSGSRILKATPGWANHSPNLASAFASKSLVVKDAVDRLGFEPRTSCLQSRRSSADLPAPTRAQRRGADETFRGDSRSNRVRPGSTLIRIPEMKGRWDVPKTEPSDGLSG